MGLSREEAERVYQAVHQGTNLQVKPQAMYSEYYEAAKNGVNRVHYDIRDQLRQDYFIAKETFVNFLMNCNTDTFYNLRGLLSKS